MWCPAAEGERGAGRARAREECLRPIDACHWPRSLRAYAGIWRAHCCHARTERPLCQMYNLSAGTFHLGSEI